MTLNMFPARKVSFVYLSGLVLVALGLGSCGNTRQLVYMQGKFDTAALSKITPPDQVIQKGDNMSIIVYSDNPEATKIYNQPLIVTSTSAIGGGGSGAQGGPTGSLPTTPGYMVDENGNIEFQGLGLLHVEGLSKPQLKDTLTSRLKELLSNVYCTIRFLNHKFTVLGEVARPGIISIPDENVNLLEAISLSGDLTFYGRRDNVLIIREEDGKRIFGRLDLTKPDIMASPYFYVRQNDIVIVEPTRKKIAANDQVTTRNITIAATVISTLALLYSIFKK
jgi:polysaccharide export outer membrane protein